MGQTCSNCSEDLFVGERICPGCRTPVEGIDPFEHGGDGSPPPPPEGIGLLIAKQQSDFEAFRHEGDQWTEEDLAVNGTRLGGPGMRVGSRDIDDIANLVRPERDRQGKVIVDVKLALVGAVVVAVAAGLGYWYVSSIVPGLPGS